MGKRKPREGLGGLGHFVLDAFKQDSNGAGSLIANTESSEGLESKEPLIKRCKTESGNGAAGERDASWVEKYDATGLIVHYSDASQVPEHLQKCACSISGCDEYK